VAREAAAQCRRVWLPEVSDTVAFADLQGLGGPGQVVLAQLSGDRPTLAQRVVAVGPEGGWSTDELASGLPTVGFGLSVLRAETAAVTAGALMASLRTGTVAPVGKVSSS
jgi:RsmE family RNA methyltransferase